MNNGLEIRKLYRKSPIKGKSAKLILPRFISKIDKKENVNRLKIKFNMKDTLMSLDSSVKHSDPQLKGQRGHITTQTGQ